MDIFRGHLYDILQYHYLKISYLSLCLIFILMEFCENVNDTSTKVSFIVNSKFIFFNYKYKIVYYNQILNKVKNPIHIKNMH